MVDKKRKHGGGGGRRQPREKAYGVSQNNSDSDEMVVPVVGPNPYNGQPGYGQGQMTAPGGNVERGESHRAAVARETVEELQGRFQQVSFNETPISQNVAGGARYTVYPQTVSPANPPIQPGYGQDPRAFQESASVHQVRMSQLPGVYPHSTNTEILQAYSQQVGAPSNPATMNPQERRQWDTYTDPGNYPPQAVANTTRSYLQPPTQPQPSSNSNSSSSDGSDGDGRGHHKHKSGHRSKKSTGPEAQKDWSQYETKRDRDHHRRGGGGGRSQGGGSSAVR